jgi:hypothetical protein
MGLLAIILIVVFWFYGAPMSEEASYQLALSDVKLYTSEHQLDLRSFNSPKLGLQANKAIYMFEWTPKNGGKSITATVDPMRVKVTIAYR